MKKEFKRNPIFPIILLLPAITFGVTTILQFAIGNPAAILTLIASILFFVNSIWSFSNPLIRIDSNKIFFKESLLKQKEILISNIERIEIPKDKLLKIHKKDGSVVKIKLDMLKRIDRENLKNILSGLINEKPTANKE